VDAPAAVSERAALVTGGSSGIGRAVAEDLAAHGRRVVVLDRERPTVPFGTGVQLVLGDVRSAADNERAVAAAVRGGAALDVLVANAGVHDGGRQLRELTGAELDDVARQVLDVDVLGYLHAARAAAGQLARAGGSVVCTLSDASFEVRGNGSGVVYTAAKHAALGVVRHLAADLAPQVRVNAVAPGGIVTGLRETSGRRVYERAGELGAAIRAHNPLGALLAPEQLAPLYRFLAGPDAAGMTGEVLRPDGGLSVS